MSTNVCLFTGQRSSTPPPTLYNHGGGRGGGANKNQIQNREILYLKCRTLSARRRRSRRSKKWNLVDVFIVGDQERYSPGIFGIPESSVQGEEEDGDRTKGNKSI